VSPHIMPKDFMFTDANYTSGFARFIERKALEESPYTLWMIAPESDVMHSKKKTMAAHRPPGSSSPCHRQTCTVIYRWPTVIAGRG
jgi:hypothetical protein